MAIVVVALAVGLSASFDLGPFRSFEDRLRASVSLPDCARVTTNHHGYYGDDYAGLHAAASRVFMVSCEVGGPDAVLYEFAGPAELRAGIESLPARPYSVCVARRHAEILIAYDNPDFRDLCEARDGDVR